MFFFFFNDTATTEIYTLSLHDALPISRSPSSSCGSRSCARRSGAALPRKRCCGASPPATRSSPPAGSTARSPRSGTTTSSSGSPPRSRSGSPGARSRASSRRRGRTRSPSRRPERTGGKLLWRAPVSNRRQHLTLMGLILAALVGALLLAIPGSPAHKKPTLGLDLQGGLEVVLKAVPPKGHTLTAADLDRSVSIMRSRIDKLGVSEPEIRKQGSDQIVIQLAGVHDPK